MEALIVVGGAARPFVRLWSTSEMMKKRRLGRYEQGAVVETKNEGFPGQDFGDMVVIGRQKDMNCVKDA